MPYISELHIFYKKHFEIALTALCQKNSSFPLLFYGKYFVQFSRYLYATWFNVAFFNRLTISVQRQIVILYHPRTAPDNIAVRGFSAPTDFIFIVGIGYPTTPDFLAHGVRAAFKSFAAWTLTASFNCPVRHSINAGNAWRQIFYNLRSGCFFYVFSITQKINFVNPFRKNFFDFFRGV